MVVGGGGQGGQSSILAWKIPWTEEPGRLQSMGSPRLALSKNQLLAVLIFAMVSFVSFAFISALIFKISFLLLTLGFFISYFSNCFRCRVRLFI